MTIKPGQVYLHKNQDSIFMNRLIVLEILPDELRVMYDDTRDRTDIRLGKITLPFLLQYQYSHDLTQLELLLWK